MKNKRLREKRLKKMQQMLEPKASLSTKSLRKRRGKRKLRGLLMTERLRD